MSIYTSEWKPRWYYILQNKTSNKLYLGQTKQDINLYLGSGSYWINHCKKHGGYTRENINTLWCEYYIDEKTALQFLKDFEDENPNYWRRTTNESWANQTRENTSDCTFDTYEWDESHRETWLNNTYRNNEWRETVMAASHAKAKAKLLDRNHLEEIGAIENWSRARREVVQDPIREQQRIDRFKESYYNTINDVTWRDEVWEPAKKKISEASKKHRAEGKASRLRECPICNRKIDCANLQRHINKHGK